MHVFGMEAGVPGENMQAPHRKMLTLRVFEPGTCSPFLLWGDSSPHWRDQHPQIRSELSPTPTCDLLVNQSIISTRCHVFLQYLHPVAPESFEKLRTAGPGGIMYRNVHSSLLASSPATNPLKTTAQVLGGLSQTSGVCLPYENEKKKTELSDRSR